MRERPIRPKVDYEHRFETALRTIVAYMTTAQLQRQCERDYGLSYAEVLEMAYENVREEAKDALRGYRRKPRAGTVEQRSHSVTSSASAAPK